MRTLNEDADAEDTNNTINTKKTSQMTVCCAALRETADRIPTERKFGTLVEDVDTFKLASGESRL